VTGVDIAPRAIEAATKFLASRNLVAELHVSDAVGFEPGSRYDLVLSSFALPATEEDQRKFYRLVTSCLAPGGTVLIKDFDASMGRLEVFQSFHCPTLDEFRRAFDGLEIQTCEIVDTDRGDGGDIPWTAAVFQARS
jgi:spermidine synthase